MRMSKFIVVISLVHTACIALHWPIGHGVIIIIVIIVVVVVFRIRVLE
jgi:hypothetical protein